ncbi:hypothetical protein BS333_13110 [Vibrio azureus]|uniref:OmpR/PhoB-type domain-containing protein n=1 Tax=Vibrio azureus NBRC 104587 TaxID=1219077 RepID=U3AV00_9VIBR|nr:lysine decarboxylation/transport transcriptional activator CadC [Vibrio azureus]AUI87226.1 hypothetical protein BS333_13110 [Vibrio azureus]GAD77580.1 hypothetical protein VAZ01S_081_00010 [Vibrio azureus NBRC 104587]
MVGSYFQINDWILNIDENKLYRQDKEVNVEPRLINLLHFMVRHPNRIFNRDELIESVWGGAAVTEQVVTQSIFELRKLLRDGRADSINYVITVPKRGYKLVTTVKSLSHMEFISACLAFGINISSESCKKIEQEPTRTDKYASVEQTLPTSKTMTAKCADMICHLFSLHKKVSHRRLNVMNFFLFSALATLLGTLAYSQPNKPTKLDANVIEFQFRDHISRKNEFYSLADGFAQKLMFDVALLSDFEVINKVEEQTSAQKAGKTIFTSIKGRHGKDIFEVEYRDNILDKVIFKRDYVLKKDKLRSLMRHIPLELLRKLNVPKARLKSKVLNAGLPMDADALELFIEANHFLSIQERKPFQHGIDLLEKTLSLEKDNAYVQAELLVAYHIQQALKFEPELNMNRLKELERKLEANVRMQLGFIQPKIYEALALHSMLNGKMSKAKKYLRQGLKVRNSVLSYVLLGKYAEIDGDIKRAKGFYMDALVNNGSKATYQLCEKLVFSSDMKVVLGKLAFQHSSPVEDTSFIKITQ